MEMCRLNPLEIPEILNLILGYVGSDTKQLLQSRLVCQSFNASAVQLIPAQQITLTSYDLNSYREMKLKQLLQNTNQVVPSVQLCLKIDINESTRLKHLTDSLFQHYNAIVEYIVSFALETRKFAAPITSLHFNTLIMIQIDVFWKLIQLLAPNLVELHSVAFLYLPIDDESDISSDDLIKEQISSSFNNIEFPHLKYLHFVIQDSNLLEGFVIPELVSTLILKSTSGGLTTLGLTDENVGSIRGRAPEAQKIQRFDTLLKRIGGSYNRLTKFEIMIYNLDILNTLCSMSFPALIDLTLHEQKCYHLDPRFQQFLKDQCPALSAFTMNLLPSEERPNAAEFEEVYRLVLYKIDVFGMYLCQKASERSLKNLMLCCKTFRGATQFNTDFKTIGVLRDMDAVVENLPPEYQDLIIFPEVSTVKILADETNHFISNENAESFRRISSRLWPNVNTLIVDRPELEARQTRIRAVECGILINILSLIGIITLELRTNIMELVEDWLTEIFKQNPLINPIKRSLQTLILRLPTGLKQQVHGPRDISRYLSTICETFPNLQKLILDEGLLKNYQHLSLDEIIDLGQLRSRYTNIKFELLLK